MKIFITGTDTNIGKTIICSWLCLHTGYEYFKPIQTGASEGTDSALVSELAGVKIHQELYKYNASLSPNQAAILEDEEIKIEQITIPKASNLIVEGAGGVLVPLGRGYLMIDLIKHLDIPVIIVANAGLGTINHTVLSIEALRGRGVEVLGVILSGKPLEANRNDIEFYGKTKVLAQLPFIYEISRQSLIKIPITYNLKELLK